SLRYWWPRMWSGFPDMARTPSQWGRWWSAIRDSQTPTHISVDAIHTPQKWSEKLIISFITDGRARRKTTVLTTKYLSAIRFRNKFKYYIFSLLITFIKHIS